MTELTAEQEAAAMWGLALNPALPIADRLACALKALDYYGPDDEEG